MTLRMTLIAGLAATAFAGPAIAQNAAPVASPDQIVTCADLSAMDSAAANNFLRDLRSGVTGGSTPGGTPANPAPLPESQGQLPAEPGANLQGAAETAAPAGGEVAVIDGVPNTTTAQGTVTGGMAPLDDETLYAACAENPTTRVQDLLTPVQAN